MTSTADQVAVKVVIAMRRERVTPILPPVPAHFMRSPSGRRDHVAGQLHQINLPRNVQALPFCRAGDGDSCRVPWNRAMASASPRPSSGYRCYR